MKDILLAVTVLAVFAVGYFAICRFGKFLDENYRERQEPRSSDGKVYIIGAEGKSTETISKEVGTLLDSFPDRDEYEIIICRTGDTGIIEYLEQSGCTMEDGHRN